MNILILNILLWVMIYIILGLSHGYIAKQLEYMNPKKDANKLVIKYKGKWHLFFGLLRLLLHISFPLFFYLYTNFNLLESIKLGLVGVTIGILFFDSMVNLGRKRKISWKYIGTCEKFLDGDCIWLWLEKKHLPHFVVKFILIIGSILWYIYD